jgi:ubiquinone/menaquinone biosynthesis C-methylase UbiE
LNTTAVREFPDVHSSSLEYRERFAGYGGRALIIRQSRVLRELLKEKQTVLDVGGGHFQACPHLIDLGCKVTVLGSNAEGDIFLKDVKKYCDVEYIVGELTKLPCDDQSYDQVVSLRQLCHLDDWQRFLGEICRVAKNEVIFDYPVKSSLNLLSDKLFSVKKSVESNTRTYQVFTDEEIRKVLEKNGFKVTTIKRVQFLAAALFRIKALSLIVDKLEDFFQMLGVAAKLGSPVLVRAERR